MNTDQDRQYARAAYNWLRISPLATILTYLLISGIDPGYLLCNNDICEEVFGYSFGSYLTSIFAILGSALWHLTLLRFLNSNHSEFVQKHGRRALRFAGIRTAIPLAFVTADYFLGASFILALCGGVPLLFILWLNQTKIGHEEIDRELGAQPAPATNDTLEESFEPTYGDEMTEPLETYSDTPQGVLNEILIALKNEEEQTRLQAIAKLETLSYSSEAIRNRLEQLSLHDASSEVCREALAALNQNAQRAVQTRLNKVDRGTRYVILKEIETWEKNGLLETRNADVLRRRYDFDFAPPPPAPQPAPVTEAAKPQPAPVTAPPAPQPEPQPAGPRLTLLQTLLSETSIKIFLYLGAFFVIASAIILGIAVPGARLPVLITGTLIFGGISIAIKKRLPQPSFALFIVFSFLLPITANVIEDMINFADWARDGYWVVISLVMALVWAGSTWLYESRLFSLTAYIALLAAFFRVGNTFDADPEFHVTMTGLGAMAGLAGTWALKKWKDMKFAFPLFLAAQLTELIVLAATLVVFGIKLFDLSSKPLWHFMPFLTWAFAFVFFIFSNWLYPFLLFPWFTAATLIPMPWFIAAALDLESLPSMILFLLWGLTVSAASEIAHRFEATQKYGLPVLLVSIPTFALALITGFAHETLTGMFAALGVFFIYSLLHIVRARGWLWALALLHFVIAYFAFFTLPAIEKFDPFFGYILLAITLLFLLPDLLWKGDLKATPVWRLPLRVYGAIFTLWLFVGLASAELDPSIETSIVFGVLAVFYAAYALRFRMAYIGFIATSALALSVLYAVHHFQYDFQLEALIVLGALYAGGGFLLRKKEEMLPWRNMLSISGLVLSGICSFAALGLLKEHSGWFVALTGALFLVEMYSRRVHWFEAGAHIFMAIAVGLILRDLHFDEAVHILPAVGLTWLLLDMVFKLTFQEPRPMEIPVKALGGITALMAAILLIDKGDAQRSAVWFGIYTAFLTVYALAQKQPAYGYAPAAYLPLTVYFILESVERESLWLPVLTGLAVLYFVFGLAIRTREGWSFVMRNSALGLGTVLSFGALIAFEPHGGWYALAAGLLFAAEMYLRRDGVFEAGMPVLFTIGVFLILRDLDVNELGYHLLAYSLVWLLTDLLGHLTFANPRPLRWLVRAVGGVLAAANSIHLFINADAKTGAVCFGIYTLLFLAVSLLYRQPNLLYTFTVFLPLFVTFLFRSFELTKWIHPVVAVAAFYYAAGYWLRRANRAAGWETPLLFSGLGLGLIVSAAAPALGGLDAALPVAITATLWAAEAFARRNAWLGFPVNGLYLLAYFIILFELDVTEVQFFSMGAALLGMGQHYLLTRAESKWGAFLVGMVSQFILLGTTYIEMVNKNELIYFVVLFFQSLAVLVYGIVVRSRSLTFFPIGFVVLGVVTVIYSALKGISTVVIIGCTGILLLMLGILAVIMRERITKLGERLSHWKA